MTISKYTVLNDKSVSPIHIAMKPFPYKLPVYHR